MNDRNFECLVVLDNEKPVGIVTKKDPNRRVIAKDLDPAKIAIEQVMSKPLINLSLDGSIENAAKLMVTHNIGKLPITERSKLVGIVTETELTKTL